MIGYLKNMAVNLKEGRLPENDEEVIISESIYTNGGVKFEIGDILNLDISKRVNKSGEELTQREIKDEEAKESLEKKYSKSYKIVGIMKRPAYGIEEYSAPGYTIITKMDNILEKANIAIVYENIKDTRNITKDISKLKGKNLNNKEEYETYLNKELLQFSGAALTGSTMSTVYYLAVIVMVIVLVSSVFVIKNGFAISITERLKQYGMLASIGTTKKQIKKSVYFEGLTLGLIGIPIGIISGIIAIFILLKVVNLILGEFLDGFSFNYSISISAIGISILIAAVTIFFSCISSARKASKVAPMDLIRSSDDIKLKSKKIRAPKVISKIFKVGGEIAYKNLKRSKKKYRATIISLVVSIVIFISISSFIDYGFKMSNVYYQELGYNIRLYYYSDKEKDIGNEIYKEIAKFDNVNEYSIQRTNLMDIDRDKYYSNLAKEKLVYDEENKTEKIVIKSLGEKEYKRFISEIGENYDKCKNSAILIDTCIYFGKEKKTEINIYNLEAGDTITGEIDEKEITIDIVKRTDKKPMGMEGYNDYMRIFNCK